MTRARPARAQGRPHPTTESFDVSSTVREPAVVSPTHSSLPSGVRARVSGSPASEIVLLTLLVAASITDTEFGSGLAT